ncbi:M56 family metallopeptidase [Mycolicibacterium vinylchloridicum]|uniref:M56 family metallopeptidase n=1 Tax=Mycolicibacterium vinylchloridicum TaxID=2736928 RepID=UPI0015C72F4C|nr:M56 family metallopeptidase [Mycolicibacterium vinylchloridicum]
MTGAVLWTIGGLLVGVFSPPLLRRGMRRNVDAGLLLTLWAIPVCLAVSAIAVPLVTKLAHGCWLPPDSGLPHWVNSVAASLSGTAVVIAVVRGTWQLGSTALRRRRVHARHVELAWLLTGKAPQPRSVLWLPTPEPHAYSLAGNPPLVVMSEGVRRCLGQAAVSAVDTHERAHIRRRHHLFMAVAQALSAGLGWLPLTRQSPSLVRTLIELDADAQAARVHGTWPVRQAIQALQHTAAPAVALGIAGERAQLRLARLTKQTPDGTTRRSRSAAAVAMMAATALALCALTVGVTLASCGP